MGYGIKLLATQSCLLPQLLNGNPNVDEYAEEVKTRINMIYEVNDKLFRLSFFNIDFIANCKTLFRISEPEDDEEEDVWDNIYNWKYKYSQMEWDELRPIVENLIEIYALDNSQMEEAKTEWLGNIQILHSIVDITRTFEIN